MSLSPLLSNGAVAADVAAHLDGLDHAARVTAVRALRPRELGRLWTLAEGAAVDLAHFVPAGVPGGEPVRHLGVNSLPAFRQFEKRFLRPEDGRERLYGYNHQALMCVTGPGYFVVDPATEGDELFIDYYEVPPARPREDWPPVRDNEGLPSRLVYGRMRDRMRGVSGHVSIGRAFKDGKAMDTWFALVRESA